MNPAATETESKKTKCCQEEQPRNSMDSLPRLGEQPRKSMDNLPQEIVNDILSRLSITSLIHVRCVCRSWSMLSRDKHLASLHLLRNKYTCLILHSDYPILNQLHFAEFSDLDDAKDIVVKKIRTPFCTSMSEFNVVGSCNGLLCLSDSLFSGSLYIFNPFTGDYKELPRPSQFQDQEVMFAFGFQPAINEYKVVKIAYNRLQDMRSPLVSEIQVLSLSTDTWRRIGEVPFQLKRQSSDACLVNGRLHWVTRSTRHDGVGGGKIVSFDLDNEGSHEVPKPDFGFLKRSHPELSVFKGCLSAAVFIQVLDKCELWILKEYNVKESWIKGFNIDGYLREFRYPEDLRRPCGIWGNVLRQRIVGFLCLPNNGHILLDHKGGGLVSYNPESGELKNLRFQGMPTLFQTIVHVGSLNLIDN